MLTFWQEIDSDLLNCVDHQMVLHAIGNNRAGEAAGAAGRGVSNHGSRALRESMAEVTAFARRSEKGGAINQVRKRKFQADKMATLKAPRGRPA